MPLQRGPTDSGVSAPLKMTHIVNKQSKTPPLYSSLILIEDVLLLRMPYAIVGCPPAGWQGQCSSRPSTR